MRTSTDYKDFSTPEPAKVREMLEQARAFVLKVEALVQAA